jgi:hypothetical protein
MIDPEADVAGGARHTGTHTFDLGTSDQPAGRVVNLLQVFIHRWISTLSFDDFRR